MMGRVQQPLSADWRPFLVISAVLWLPNPIRLGIAVLPSLLNRLPYINDDVNF